jgi:glycosidase
MENLNKILDCLTQLSEIESIAYSIPVVWLNPSDLSGGSIEVEPANFYSTKIEQILNTRINSTVERKQVAYNMFIRHTAAFDHDGDGTIKTESINGIWRETGTFLKAIALLPYIRSLGCNLLYLLPVTAIGKEGRKGNLGSPYAIANPYELDSALADNLPGISDEEQFSALIEAAHLLGIRVITEFVFRTASVDSPLALEHPDWFYWLGEDVPERAGYTNEPGKYGPPFFSEDILVNIRTKIKNKDYTSLPEPETAYQSLFTDIPVRVKLEDGKIIGTTNDGTKCRIASAFADWPPDDEQPVWSDVTYLRLFDDDKFNYIAYNTVRMYDAELNQTAKRKEDVWEHIAGIIPHYINKFGIDGVMIDMGHALPDELLTEIIARARAINPDFIFWEENFNLTIESKEKGFNASLGYMPFDQHKPHKMNEIIEMLAWGSNPVPFFLTPETHNTKRAAGRSGRENYTKYTWAINNFLPGILFIHSGFELGESKPVNTGLEFEPYEIEAFPAYTLPLFSGTTLDWTKKPELLSFIRKVRRIASENDIINITPVQSMNPEVIAFIACSLIREIIVIASLPDSKSRNTLLSFVNDYSAINDYLGSRKLELANNELLLTLEPNEIIIGEIN